LGRDPSATDLVASLRALEDLLRKHRVKYADVVASVRQDVESGSSQSLATSRLRVQSLFGGMGTVTDVVITKRNGHEVGDEVAANDELERLVDRLWLVVHAQTESQMSEQDFAKRFEAELDEATRQAEEALGGVATRKYKIAFGEPGMRPLLDVKTVVERLYARAPLIPRIIDIAVIGLEDNHTLMFVRPSDHSPSGWEETWNVPLGRGPFKILVSERIDDRRRRRPEPT